MSKAHRVRTIVDIAGMALALGTMFALQNLWLGLLAAGAIFLVTHYIAERAFAALASSEEVRADLRDRTDNGE